MQNWKSTELGKHYNIYEEDGEIVGQQYPSDTGPIDILAISKDKRSFLSSNSKKEELAMLWLGKFSDIWAMLKTN